MSYTPPNTDPGQWQPTGPDFSPAGAVHVSHVKPYAVVSMDQFLPGPPPALDSEEYATAFNEVKTLGVATGSTRTDDQTLVAGLWRTALNNHQVWNRIAQDVADIQGSENCVLTNVLERYALQLIVLTRGPNGSLLISRTGERTERTCIRVDVADTVGAGDAFTAALTLGLVHRLPLERLHRWAGQVAEYVCTQPGGTPEFPDDLTLTHVMSQS